MRLGFFGLFELLERYGFIERRTTKIGLKKTTVFGVNKLKSDLTVKAESSSWDFGT